LAEAEERTREAQAALQACRNILSATLSVDDHIDFEELKRKDDFAAPPTDPVYRDIPAAPRRENPRYQPDLSLFDKLIPPLRRKKEAAAQAEFDRDTAKYKADLARITDENHKIYHSVLAQRAAWNAEKDQFEKKKKAHNAAIDAKAAAYRLGEPKAVLEYCDMVLTRSRYPDLFPKEFTLDFLEETGTVIADYTLPDYPSLPRLAEVRYNKSKDGFTEKNITESEAQRLYADLLVQTSLRTVHELFEADTVGVVTAVVFNGWVRGINPATGRMEAACLASVHTRRPTFLSLNLSNVEPRLCFDQLGGVLSSKPQQMVGIRPLVSSSDDSQPSEPPAYAERLGELAASDAMEAGVAFIPAGELRQLVGLPEEARASVQASRQLVEKLNSDGYCVEPDASLQVPRPGCHASDAKLSGRGDAASVISPCRLGRRLDRQRGIPCDPSPDRRRVGRRSGGRHSAEGLRDAADAESIASVDRSDQGDPPVGAGKARAGCDRSRSSRGGRWPHHRG
jgi:hypothetical protein